MAKPGSARQGDEASWKPIHDALHDAIIRHRLDPGAKLVEDEIAELFGVSRTIVRTALQALSRDGVVVIQRNRGASVAQPLPEEAREIFEARALVEPAIAAMAAARMAPVDGDRLRACLAAEHAATAADDLREAIFLSAEFHRVIAGLAGHAVLATIVGDLLSRSSLVVALYWRRPEAMCESHAHHAIVDALEAADGERAAALMRTHLVDLLAGLDLSVRPSRRSSLAEALAAGPDSGRSAFLSDSAMQP
jgi:DNA-binding GntR family transcriptional regulator